MIPRANVDHWRVPRLRPPHALRLQRRATLPNVPGTARSCSAAPPSDQKSSTSLLSGIAVAVSTIIAVIALGRAGVESAEAELDKLGDNLVWVEGPRSAGSLGRSGHYPITGTNVELSFHHPKLNQPWTWTKLLKPTGQPRVEGEESQYSSPTRPECYDSAYAEMPKLLAALAKYHDGLIAWALEPGVLIASRSARHVTDTLVPSDPASARGLSRPSRLKPAYGCTRKQPTQGMGELAMQFFKRYAAKDNPYAVSGNQR